MTTEIPRRQDRPRGLWYRRLVRTRTPWLLGALIVAVALVVRSTFEEGPGAVQADTTRHAFETTPQAPNDATEAEPLTRPRRKRGIARDFFVWERGSDAALDPVEAIEPMPAREETPQPSREVSARATMSGLALQAIVLGDRPGAFLNDRFVTLGEQIVIEGQQEVVCEVRAIYEDSVELVGEGITVVLRLAEPPRR